MLKLFNILKKATDILHFTKKMFFITSCLVLLNSCTATKNTRLKKNLNLSLNNPVFQNSFTGFMVYNPVTKDTLLNHNAHKYFTPASTTKIITLYTSLKLLPDSIPSLKYSIENDTLFVEGTGDPSFLHPNFKDSSALKLMDKYNNIAMLSNNYKDEKFGPGWAWEDYPWYFSPERNAFPINGNVVSIDNTKSLLVEPAYFKEYISPLIKSKNRKQYSNEFFYNPKKRDSLEVPFMVSDSLTKTLLENALQKKITLVKKMPSSNKKTLYSIPSDSLYKRMMHYSDNFLAEQLLILGASTIADTLDSKKAKEFILKNDLSNLKQAPRWVDGSGLSRYNLFTPETMVTVLNKLYHETSKERLFTIFPHGGDEGTMKKWFVGNPKPYIYAKSGSLGNNYCLSGYLLTNSGKTLIFSFMNNHFREPTATIKQEMEFIFKEIRDQY